MAYDTIKLKSPPMDISIVRKIQNQCMLRTGMDLASGEVLYEIFTGELLGSWDARISVLPKFEEWLVGKSGRPELHPCEPYLLVEASVHKAIYGQNVYGGHTEFKKAAQDLIFLLEDLLGQPGLPAPAFWTVHRVDVASVYVLSKAACKEFFDGVQLLSFPRRQRQAAKYDMAVYFAGKTTTVKFYHKGSEFAAHEKARLSGFFGTLFAHMFGHRPENRDLVERKITALQRLADRRLRAEVEIHSDKFQYDFHGRNPRVDEVTDEYLHSVHDREIERLLREGKQAMETVRTTQAVLHRLKNVYGDSKGMRLFGFWSSLCTLGVDVVKKPCNSTKATYYRNRKLLEDAGVSWRGSDVVVVSNDSVLPHDFSPVRTDVRLCTLPARNRPEYQVSREMLRLAA